MDSVQLTLTLRLLLQEQPCSCFLTIGHEDTHALRLQSEVDAAGVVGREHGLHAVAPQHADDQLGFRSRASDRDGDRHTSSVAPDRHSVVAPTGRLTKTRRGGQARSPPTTVQQMFTPPQRERLRERLTSAARRDPSINAAAYTGSYASGKSDRWSDIDLAFGVAGDLAASIASWTAAMYRDHGAQHHWDLAAGSATYRVFLLSGWLEVDLAFFPEEDFGPRGPNWSLIFGPDNVPSPEGMPDPDAALPELEQVLGRCWHHCRAAAVAIHRGKMWRAEWWISEARRHLIELACQRHGLPTTHGRGTDALPPDELEVLRPTLARDLTDAEVRRVLQALCDVLAIELRLRAAGLADRIVPMLDDLRASVAERP